MEEPRKSSEGSIILGFRTGRISCHSVGGGDSTEQVIYINNKRKDSHDKFRRSGYLGVKEPLDIADLSVNSCCKRNLDLPKMQIYLILKAADK